MDGDLFLDYPEFADIWFEIEKRLGIKLLMEEINVSIKCNVGELCEKVSQYMKEYDSSAKCLPICFPPPMYFSLHVAIALSMILADNENKDWFYNHFVQVSFYNKYAEIEGSHKYCIYPAMEMRPGQIASGKFIKETHVNLDIFNLKEDTLYDNIKLFIENGYYISCVADVSKIKGTRYEGESFFYHGLMIYGYDNKTKSLDIVDFDDRNAINRIKISMEDFIAAFTSPKLLETFGEEVNNSIILFRRKKSEFTFDLRVVMETLRDYLDSYNTGRRYALLLPSDEESTWGIETYGKIIEYIEQRKSNWDIRMFHAFYEHKKLMAERFRYIRKKGIYNTEKKVLCGLEENKKLAEIIKMMVIKFNLTGQGELVPQVIMRLKEIKNREILLYEKIFSGWTKEDGYADKGRNDGAV